MIETPEHQLLLSEVVLPAPRIAAVAGDAAAGAPAEAPGPDGERHGRTDAGDQAEDSAGPDEERPEPGSAGLLEEEPDDAEESEQESDAPEEPEQSEQGSEQESEQESEQDAAEAAAAAERARFAELVEERVRRARYGHHLTRAVFTPAEAALVASVERRAAVWVPTMTILATLVSAIAAVVLATRLRSDPTDPNGNQLALVTVTVCLLAAAFGTLLRAEIHYQRIRPTGRVVRHDIADAYEVVREAPARLVRNDAPLAVLRRVADLLPVAEQLVDVLAAYIADGGTRVRAHPAYERITRMRAEVEALEVMLEETVRSAVPDPVHGVEARLPHADQVADYDDLVDLAESLRSQT